MRPVSRLLSQLPNPVDTGTPQVERPWWAVSNVAKKALSMMVAATAIASIATASALVIIPTSPLVITAFAITAIAFATLACVFEFESLRRSGLLGPKAQRVADAIHANALEAIGVLAAAALYPFALFRKDPKVTPAPDSKPILLVHGYLHNSSGWAYMKARLRHAKLGPVYTINLGNPITLRSIDEYAAAVQAKVDQIVAETGSQKVVIVGHSMGGIVGTQALTSLDAHGHIDKVITMGTPLEGSMTSHFTPGKCARQMRYSKKNTYLHNLREKLRAFGHKVHCFHSHSDVLILPNRSAAMDHTDNTLFADHGHLRYLWSDRAIDKVISLLRI